MEIKLKAANENKTEIHWIIQKILLILFEKIFF